MIMKKYTSVEDELYDAIYELFGEMDCDRVEVVNDEDNGRTYAIKLYIPNREGYHDLWEVGVEVNCCGFNDIFTVGSVCLVGAYGYNSILSADVDIIELMVDDIVEKFDTLEEELHSKE